MILITAAMMKPIFHLVKISQGFEIRDDSSLVPSVSDGDTSLKVNILSHDCKDMYLVSFMILFLAS